MLPRAVLVLIAIWPAGLGLLWLYADLAIRGGPTSAAVFVSLLFCLTAIFMRTPLVKGLFARWQIICGAVLAAVYAYGLYSPSFDPAVAFVRAVIDLSLVLGALALVLLLRMQGPNLIRHLMLALVMSMALYLVFFAMHVSALVGQANANWVDAFLPFVNVRRLTYLLAPISVLALGLWAVAPQDQGPSRHLLLVLWVVFSTFLLWSGGRAAVLAVSGGIVIIGAAGLPGCRKVLFAGGTIGLFIGSALSLILPRVSGAFGFWQRLFANAQEDSVATITSDRTVIWSETVSLIPRHLWFGHGPNQWAFQNPELRWHGSSHSLTLQSLHDFGLIGGGAALLLVFGTLAVNVLRLRRAGGLHQVAVLMLCVMVLQSFFDANFFGVASLQIALFGFAMAHAAANPPVRQDDAKGGGHPGS